MRRLAAATPNPSVSPAWESVRVAMRLPRRPTLAAGGGVLFSVRLCAAAPAFQAYAQLEFTPGRPLLEAAIGLMARIHHGIHLRHRQHRPHHPGAGSLQPPPGRCQDFAHIMIACLRSLGLPARFTSAATCSPNRPGQPRLLGVDASHAWLAVWCPQHDWVELDPPIT